MGKKDKPQPHLRLRANYWLGHVEGEASGWPAILVLAAVVLPFPALAVLLRYGWLWWHGG